MDRVFLDANVLFSAAYDASGRIAELWKLPDVELVTSAYAAAEAYRNLASKVPRHLKRLRELLRACGLSEAEPGDRPPVGVELPEDDRPILLAAMACRATHLLTGDTHFRACYGRTIGGVLVLRPGDYLRSHR